MVAGTLIIVAATLVVVVYFARKCFYHKQASIALEESRNPANPPEITEACVETYKKCTKKARMAFDDEQIDEKPADDA